MLTASSYVVRRDPARKLPRESGKLRKDQQGRVNLVGRHGLDADRVPGIVPGGTDLMCERRPVRLESLEQRGRHGGPLGDQGLFDRGENALDPPVAEACGNRLAQGSK